MTNSQVKSTNRHPVDQIPPHLIASDDGKFKAKLDQKDRYRALAAVLAGIKKDVVAAAFGVDRRTISHMVNPHSKHYKLTREKEQAMGTKEFVREYFDEYTLNKIKSADLSVTVREEKDDGIPKPNPRAKSKEGINVVKPDQCKYNHRIKVAFQTNRDQFGYVGWWYQDMDGPEPTEWFRGDEASMMTSQDCLAAAMQDIYDV